MPRRPIILVNHLSLSPLMVIRPQLNPSSIGTKLLTNQPVAIKFVSCRFPRGDNFFDLRAFSKEPRKSDAPQLRDEFRSYRALNGTCVYAPPVPLVRGLSWFSVGVPQVHHFGQEGLHNVLVIDLLGPNLEDLFDMCGRKFTIKTVCMAAKQMVSSIDITSYLHVCVPTKGVVIVHSVSWIFRTCFSMDSAHFRSPAFSRSTTSRSFIEISSLITFSLASPAQKPPILFISLVRVLCHHPICIFPAVSHRF